MIKQNLPDPVLSAERHLWFEYLWEAHNARTASHWGGVNYLKGGPTDV